MNRPFDAVLRDELIRAARRPPRRARVVGLGTIAVLAAMLGFVIVLGGSDTASADVRISRRDGRIEVLLTDLRNSPESVETAMRAEGLEVQVEAVPAGPSNVGRFVGERTSTGGTTDMRRVDETRAAFMGFSIPAGWQGRLTVLLGRAARPGEPYATFSDAFAPGEPLACTAGAGRPLNEFAQALSGFEVMVQGSGGSSGEPLALDLEAALDDEHGRWIVTAAFAISADDLIVQIAETNPTSPQEARC